MTMPLPISLIVTVKNDPEGLITLLQAINQQTAAPQEIILTIVNDHSLLGQNTISVAHKWRPIHPQTSKIIKLLPNKESTTRSHGRNVGAQLASAPILAFTDAGCLPSKNWLIELGEPFSDPNVKVVSGFTWWSKNKHPFLKAQLPFCLVNLSNIVHTDPHQLNPATRNMAIRGSTFHQLSGFNDQLNFAEDYEFAQRLSQNNIPTVFAPLAYVDWQPRPTLTQFATMIFKLTLGDRKAGSVRQAHWSIPLRYVLIVLLGFAASVVVNFPAVLIILTFIVLYLLAKSVYLVCQDNYLPLASQLWIPLLQLTTDLAIMSALFWHSIKQLNQKSLEGSNEY